ncbi:MAG: hypothetical protein WKF71_19710 [Pyrinomonadaceae bacterium]
MMVSTELSSFSREFIKVKSSASQLWRATEKLQFETIAGQNVRLDFTLAPASNYGGANQSRLALMMRRSLTRHARLLAEP